MQTKMKEEQRKKDLVERRRREEAEKRLREEAVQKKRQEVEQARKQAADHAKRAAEEKAALKRQVICDISRGGGGSCFYLKRGVRRPGGAVAETS